MANKTIEERINLLEGLIIKQSKVIEAQNLRIQRQEAVTEIQNVMSRLGYLDNAALPIMELFATRTPGVSAKIAGLYNWEGPESIQKYLGPGGMIERMQKVENKKGRLIVHALASPVIEVAKDGKTAKAVWMSPGLETYSIEGKYEARWAWVKYACDFIKEDEHWKIWHFYLYTPIIMCSYYKSWVDSPTFRPGAGRKLPEELQPSSYNDDWRPWTPDAVPELRPAPPLPYESWDNSDYMG